VTQPRSVERERHGWTSGVVHALPIVLGYIPIGIAFGILAQKAGLSTLNALLMSLIVFAGSAQLIAVGLIGAGAPPLSIVLTTFVVNLRHLLMSAAIAPHLRGWSKGELSAFAFELTDETFALHTTRFDSLAFDRAETFAINVTAHTAWVVGSAIGVTLGQQIHNVERLGLDYVLPAMFIALLVLQLKNRRQLAVALLAGALAVGLSALGLNRWNVIVATLIGATVGAFFELRTEGRKEWTPSK